MCSVSQCHYPPYPSAISIHLPQAQKEASRHTQLEVHLQYPKRREKRPKKSKLDTKCGGCNSRKRDTERERTVSYIGIRRRCPRCRCPALRRNPLAADGACPRSNENIRLALTATRRRTSAKDNRVQSAREIQIRRGKRRGR